MRKLHDSLVEHIDGILAFAEHRAPTGRIEALNNNWETLVRLSTRWDTALPLEPGGAAPFIADIVPAASGSLLHALPGAA